MQLHSSTTLNTLRKYSEDNLPEMAEVLNPVPVKKPGGGTTITYESDFFTPCRVTPFGGTPRQTMIAGQIAHPERSWTVVLSEGTQIPSNRRMFISSPEGGWTKLLTVVAASDPHSASIFSYVVGEEVRE